MSVIHCLAIDYLFVCICIYTLLGLITHFYWYHYILPVAVALFSVTSHHRCSHLVFVLSLTPQLIQPVVGKTLERHLESSYLVSSFLYQVIPQQSSSYENDLSLCLIKASSFSSLSFTVVSGRKILSISVVPQRVYWHSSADNVCLKTATHEMSVTGDVTE